MMKSEVAPVSREMNPPMAGKGTNKNADATNKANLGKAASHLRQMFGKEQGEHCR